MAYAASSVAALNDYRKWVTRQIWGAHGYTVLVAAFCGDELFLMSVIASNCLQEY